MVRFVIKTADDKVPHTDVTASRGKVLRAEPVAALCEQGRVSHVGASRARDQMCQPTAGGYLGEGSPDRLHAAVLAPMELMVDFALPGVTTTTAVAVLY
ncbi:MAG TPA: hypothetical protein VGN79_01845 [Devosia sp.]|nr:hypothetical protein [Devosia sp.]